MNRRRKSPLSQENYHLTDAASHKNSKPSNRTCVSASVLFAILLSVSILSALYTGMNRNNHGHALRTNAINESEANISVSSNRKPETIERKKNDGRTIHSLKDLSPLELHPQATSTRYIVNPPADKIPITLVTCETTKGFLHIVVHPSWAPLGASRFLRMVSTKYFSSRIAMMRCLKGFLCQFGIAGDPLLNSEYVGAGKNLKDDPNWLPEGPTHRTNELGVKRFSKGFLAYAGSGKNSRSNQLIVALRNNEGLGGGSPWEVPWGEVVGDESFATLDKIFTGYGEKGPSQGRLSREGSSKAIAEEFPNLDYILSCEVVDSEQKH
jgi:cyclophilin family peptidyl-prolyl cis-trans isomerase